MPPGTVHFSQQLEKCRKEPGETKVSPLPCALCRVRNCNLVPHVRGGFSLSQRIKGLSPAAAPLPLMPSHGRSVCIYRAGGAEPRPYGVWQGVRASAPPYTKTQKNHSRGSDFLCRKGVYLLTVYQVSLPCTSSVVVQPAPSVILPVFALTGSTAVTPGL